MKNQIFFLLLFFPFISEAQIMNSLGDESALYAETKQVNQFFRRFNNEEDKNGVKYSPTDTRYHNLSDRGKYLNILFDGQNTSITPELKSIFLNQVNNATNPVFLDFHGNDWYAEVKTRFLYKGAEKTIVLFLKLEKERMGSKWVLYNAYFEEFAKKFTTSAEEDRGFLHPMSHELDFMNLRKAFEDKRKVEDYTEKEFQPDHLTLLLYEMKNGNLKFKTVNNVKFHFFQVDNWYFEIAEFNRSGYNTGWLISSLTQVPNDQKKEFKDYVLRRK